jgi:hypothetical protein
MLIAEYRCRHPGSDPWSPALKEARLLIEIFKHALSMVRIGLESHYKLQRLLTKYTIPIDVPDTKANIQIALRIAQNNFVLSRRTPQNTAKTFF